MIDSADGDHMADQSADETATQAAGASGGSRAERRARARMLRAREVAEAVAIENGVCVRSIAMRVTDTATGTSEVVEIPCGATLESKCVPCARRNRALRMIQC